MKLRIKSGIYNPEQLKHLCSDVLFNEHMELEEEDILLVESRENTTELHIYKKQCTATYRD